jgi:hypothetical protein
MYGHSCSSSDVTSHSIQEMIVKSTACA